MKKRKDVGAVKRYQNYLFDLYGTLVDIHTREDSPALWRRFSVYLAMEGAAYPPEALREMYLQGVKEMEGSARSGMEPGAFPEIDLEPLFRRFYTGRGVEAGREDAARLARVFRALSLEKLRLYDGAEALLDRLHRAGKRVFLLSNAQALFTRPELRALGLEDRFDGSMLSSEVGRKKPDPAFYRAMLEKYGLRPEETVMIGNDDRADCHGAARAGLDSMYIFTEQSPACQQPLPPNCRRLHTILDAADGL